MVCLCVSKAATQSWCGLLLHTDVAWSVCVCLRRQRGVGASSGGAVVGVAAPDRASVDRD